MGQDAGSHRCLQGLLLVYVCTAWLQESQLNRCSPYHSSRTSRSLKRVYIDVDPLLVPKSQLEVRNVALPLESSSQVPVLELATMAKPSKRQMPSASCGVRWSSDYQSCNTKHTLLANKGCSADIIDFCALQTSPRPPMASAANEGHGMSFMDRGMGHASKLSLLRGQRSHGKLTQVCKVIVG